MALPHMSKNRRQFRAFDQCRKSKRACDAASPFTQHRQLYCVFDGQHSRCSYFLRTMRHCTLNWALSQHRRPQRQLQYCRTPAVADSIQPEKEPRKPRFDFEYATLNDNPLEVNQTGEPLSTEAASIDMSGFLFKCNSLLSDSALSVSSCSKKGISMEKPNSGGSPSSV